MDNYRSRYQPPFRWEGIEVLPYKRQGPHFRGVTRQVLIRDLPGLDAQVRYFEIEPGGYSTLERHEHAHGVIVLRGSGRVLIGEEIMPVAPYDVIRIPPMTWHQFRASEEEPLGFLCIVNAERDRPQRPSEEDLARLQEHPEIAAFIRF